MTKAQMKDLGLIYLKDAPIGSKVEGFFGVKGINRGGGYVEITWGSSDDESGDDDDGLNEWTDEVWRHSLAKASIVKMREISNARFFGPGKLDDIRKVIEEKKPDIVFINQTKMSNLQKKNLTKEWQQNLDYSLKIMDRFELILQIFASRAKSHLARYELGLAFLEYSKSLVGRDGGIPISHLSSLKKFHILNIDEKTIQVSGKQGSGKGSLGGEGEKEHSLMKNQIKAIESKLRSLIDKERAKQEAKYQDYEEKAYFRTEPRISLIGYTNVGKSAMLNALTGKEEVTSKNRLFETLKTTTREFTLTTNLKAVVVDTIGFIDNLPTELVDSFGSTLREISSSDIIVLMEDVSHPFMKRQREVAQEIITKLNLQSLLQSSKLIRVWNKIDCISKESLDELLKQEEKPDEIILTSLKEGRGLDNLKKEIEQRINILFNRKKRKLKYVYSEHEERQKWLAEECNISDLGPIRISDKGKEAYIEYQIDLAQNMYDRYLQCFEKVQGEKIRKKDQVPEGWITN